MVYPYNTKYCSILKGKEILTFATIWINVNERSQLQKDKYCMNPPHRFMEPESRKVVAGGRGRGNAEMFSE